jgi:hypothetical protein
MSYTLQLGRRYKATIKLGALESLATNAMIAGRFTALGFSNVNVTGKGGTRYAQGCGMQMISRSPCCHRKSRSYWNPRYEQLAKVT